MFRFRTLTALASCLLLSAGLIAAEVPEKQAIVQKLKASIPSLQVQSIEATPVKGLYQLESTTGDLLLVSPDGSYLVSGDLHQVQPGGGVINLTEQRRGQQRLAAMKDLKDKDLVVFKAKGSEKGQVLVFTDPTCGYCRKLHTEVEEMNNMGITVKYAAWPRSGVASPSGQTMTNIWCSNDRMAAMTKAKLTNEDVTAPAGKTCDQHVIQDQINLGFKMGVQGTPAVFLKDGRQVGGYVPAAQLAAQMGIQ
jgi:thiol:disulfide interchange protein DsbC